MTCPIGWNKHLRVEPVQGPSEIRGSLPREVWVDKQLASEQKMGRELGPWDQRQDRADGRREVAVSQSRVPVLKILDRDSPKWIL